VTETASPPVAPSPWERLVDLLFAPRSVAPMAVYRIAFGALVTIWAIAIAPDVLHFFGPDMLALPARGPGMWSVLGGDPSVALTVGVHGALLVAAIAVTVGYRTRLASLVVFVALVSFSRRDPWVYNSGDAMLRILAFYLVLMPAGEGYSLDARRRHGDWRFVARRAPWPLWLVRVQVAVLYMATALAKMRGSTWADGTAVGTALRIEDLQRFALPAFLTESLIIVNVLTFMTLAFEMAAGVLIWSRTTRRYVIGFGILLHLGIEYALQVGPFSWAILVAYLSFASADTIETWLGRERAVEDPVAPDEERAHAV
jgi:uncharacterized membrane protein YphA (DoxX/SURF4 family)